VIPVNHWLHLLLFSSYDYSKFHEVGRNDGRRADLHVEQEEGELYSVCAERCIGRKSVTRSVGEEEGREKRLSNTIFPGPNSPLCFGRSGVGLGFTTNILERYIYIVDSISLGVDPKQSHFNSVRDSRRRLHEFG
jgi:hypothetical protein